MDVKCGAVASAIGRAVLAAVLAAGLVACGGRSEPERPQTRGTASATPSGSPTPAPRPPDQLAVFCRALGPMVDDYRPGGLVPDLSDDGYDETDKEAIDKHLIDAYDLADRNRSHRTSEIAELAGGFMDDIAELEGADGSVSTRDALTAAGIFVLGTGAVCVDAGHMDPIS